jgi:type IV pilus assembly protein PilB
MKAAIVSRVKIMSSLDISERRIPQDGRINVRVGEKLIDLRVSIVPTVFGEKVVMRILDQSALMLDMKDLGFEEDSLRKFIQAIEQPYGIVLVTGPTGSGKSTTLYSALSRLNTNEVQIITAEDPIEYNLKGINQVQVNDEIGFTFAFALRAFLRQSPNIIMVGEIRDDETAEIAVRAALTGHLVLSTIHTNDAPSTINRLIDMGIKPFMVAASLNLIQAQRLVRKICKECKAEVEPDPVLMREANIDPNAFDGKKIFAGKGCARCNQSGYKGRIAITEVLPVTPGIRDMVLANASAATIREQAKKEGLNTLRDDAIIKVRNGVTTLEEVVRETASL